MWQVATVSDCADISTTAESSAGLMAPILELDQAQRMIYFPPYGPFSLLGVKYTFSHPCHQMLPSLSSDTKGQGHPHRCPQQLRSRHLCWWQHSASGRDILSLAPFMKLPGELGSAPCSARAFCKIEEWHFFEEMEFQIPHHGNMSFSPDVSGLQLSLYTQCFLSRGCNNHRCSVSS